MFLSALFGFLGAVQIISPYGTLTRMMSRFMQRPG
jgi:hypothetical protein